MYGWPAVYSYTFAIMGKTKILFFIGIQMNWDLKRLYLHLEIIHNSVSLKPLKVFLFETNNAHYIKFRQDGHVLLRMLMDLSAFDGGSCYVGNGQNVLRLSNDLRIY